jgi:hypothetical protein
MWPALRVLPHRILLPIIAWLLHPRAERPYADVDDGE